MPSTFRISSRFRGPEGFGNGGYVAGRMACGQAHELAVRLVRPVPLETDLTLFEGVDGLLELRAGEQKLASAAPAPVELSAPPAPSYEDAQAAAGRYAGFGEPPPRSVHCFACGVRREPGDGMRIFAGPLEERDLLAAAFRPHASLADERGAVRPEFVWAALDCPGYFASFRDGRFALLGELTVRIDRAVRVDEPCTIAAWALGAEGRKRYAGTALFAGDGGLAAIARATWIEPRSRSEAPPAP